MKRRKSFLLVFLLIILNTSISNAKPVWEELYEEGLKLSLQGFSEEAVQKYQDTIELKADYPEAHHALGVLYFRIGKGPDAITHFRSAESLYLGKDDDSSKKNLGIVRRNLEKAYKVFNLSSKDFDQLDLMAHFQTTSNWMKTGIGFYIGSEGYFLTPLHVVNGADRIRLTSKNFQEVPAKLIASFIIYDLAILKIQNSPMEIEKGLGFADSSAVNLKEMVYTIPVPFPSSPDFHWIQGSLLKINAVENNKRMFLIDVPISPENDGLPLLNDKGEVLGVMFSQESVKKNFPKIITSQNKASMAVKSNYFMKLWERKLNGNIKTEDKNSQAKKTMVKGKDLNAHVLQSVAIVEVKNK